jgi:hypothetical protein
MLIVGALGLTLGVVAARFFKVFFLVPAIISVGAIAALTQVLIGGGLVLAVTTALAIAVSFQIGFFAHLIFRRYIGQLISASEPPISRTLPDYDPAQFETEDVDKALPGLTEKLAQMRASSSVPAPTRKQQIRRGRKG